MFGCIGYVLICLCYGKWLRHNVGCVFFVCDICRLFWFDLWGGFVFVEYVEYSVAGFD